MRLTPLIPLVGAASAAVAPAQRPLGFFDGLKDTVSGSMKKPLKEFQAALDGLSHDAKKTWEEVANIFPEAMDAANFFSMPKPNNRQSDSTWDYVTRGEELESIFVKNADGKHEREIDGNLKPYKLRSKKVDPSDLGVDKVKQYSGYLDDAETDKHLFYWFFESRNDPKKDPVVLWLNGGPGCSSLTGLFMELGPSSIGKDGKPKFNPYSWNRNASVIFLDQPVNVGFSYSDNAVSDTVAAGKDIYALMTLFFKQFPEYAKQDFHITGESYAGHYIPVFAHEILSHKNRNINLQSVAIGNGLTDGLTQYDYYRPMACGEGGWPAVLDKQACQSMENAEPRCASLIQKCYDSQSVWSCVPASIYCNNALIGPFQRTGRNVYDVREDCKGGNLCYEELDWISSYLNKANVQKSLGAEVSNYESCNFDINRNFLFQGDWMRPYHRLVPDILKEIPVLIYAGDADYICNWLGNKAWTEALEWPGQSDYKKAPYEMLKISGGQRDIGSIKTSGNLTFVRISAAGHMVPYNQPEASLDMLNRWLGGEWSS